MKARTLVALALALVLAVSVMGPATAGKKKKKGPKAGPLVVGTDEAGDWGADGDPTLNPIGDALGQDLVEAVIAPGEEKDTIDFVIKVNSLPPTGGVPEVSRYVWDMFVDGEFVELDGKFTNYSRGACDPTSGQCPPPRDPGMQPFSVRGDCAPNDANVTICVEKGIVQGVFDSAEATITIPVSYELLGAKPGSKIEPAPNIFGGSVSANPSAFFSVSLAPLDAMTLTETYVIPKKKK
ncbi:MAG: hypothetical protein ACR2KQ_06590 [Actinomycetota bacterium]